MIRLLYKSFFLFAYITYVLVHLGFNLLLVPVLVVVVPKRFRERISSALFTHSIAFLVRGYFRALFLYRVKEISGLERARRGGPVIFVANHRGRFDGFFILSYIGSAAVLMKSTYATLPLFTTFARYLDFVTVDPTSLHGLNQTLEHCRGVLARGKNMLVFPEGTRAPGTRLLPFKDFIFRVSEMADVPVVPVIVHTDIPLMARRHNRVAPPRRFALTLRFLEPVKCAPGERPAHFAARVRREMGQALRELDKGTEWEHLAADR